MYRDKSPIMSVNVKVKVKVIELSFLFMIEYSDE